MQRTGFWESLAVALVSAGVVSAQEGPEPGCFQRVYSAEHLAAHPEQVVAEMRLFIYDHRFDGGAPSRFATIEVLTSDQGHVAQTGQGNQRFGQSLACFDQGADSGCAVDCDGGFFMVEARDAASILIRTHYLTVGETESCGGAIDLAEDVQTDVLYRLDRIDDAGCKDLLVVENG